MNLGLLPGGQGTQRLPRLVGMESALQLMFTGAPVDAGKALKMGLVDEVGFYSFQVCYDVLEMVSRSWPLK